MAGDDNWLITDICVRLVAGDDNWLITDICVRLVAGDDNWFITDICVRLVAGDDNWLITDICVRLTKRTNTKQRDSENAVIIALILELKQSLTESGKTIDGKIGQMMTIYDTESKHVIVTLMQKHWTYKCEDSIYKTTR